MCCFDVLPFLLLRFVLVGPLVCLWLGFLGESWCESFARKSPQQLVGHFHRTCCKPDKIKHGTYPFLFFQQLTSHKLQSLIEPRLLITPELENVTPPLSLQKFLRLDSCMTLLHGCLCLIDSSTWPQCPCSCK